MESTTVSATKSSPAEDRGDLVEADILERRRHNDLLPIHRLPPELLCVIIAEICRKRAYRRLFVIRSVCTYWKELVDSSSQFWTLVPCKDNETFVSMVLQRSKDQPLSIHFEDQGRETNASLQQRVIPLVGRWKALKYEAFWRHNCEQIFSLPLDNPETLFVSLPLGGRYNYQGPFRATNLRHVAVYNVTLDWTILSGLRSLDISGRGDLSIGQLYALLEASPNLEELQIARNLGPSVVPTANNGLTMPIFLPNLWSVTIRPIWLGLGPHPLDLMDAPNLRRFRYFLTDHRSSDDSFPYFEPAGRFIGKNRQSYSNKADTRFRIFMSPDTFTISLGDRRISLNIPGWETGRHGEDERQDLLCATLREFDSEVREGIKVVQFAGPQCREGMNCLCVILNSLFPYLEELVVTLSSLQDRVDGHLVLETLGSPLRPRHGGGWLFPRLTALQLKANSGTICDRILGILDARRNAGMRAIQRIEIKKGRIGRDAEARLKECLLELILDGTRYIETASPENSSGAMTGFC